MLRATIKKDRFIPLEEEIKTVKDYLFIQKTRFGDKIEVVYDIDEKAYPIEVPNFILQPLIENAIIHGLEPKVESGTLWLRIHQRTDVLWFCVEDDGVGMTEEEIHTLYEQCELNDTKKNIGLKNVYRRLILSYGEESRLVIEGKKDKGTKISFTLPMKKNGVQEEKQHAQTTKL